MALFGAGGDQSLNITIKAKDDATAAIGKVRLSIGDLAKGFALGSIATDVFRRGVALLEGVVTSSIGQYEEYQQAVAQTNTVLASTQHAAGLTADEVVKLSKTLSDGTLYQDDMVLSAENLILTFTQITKDIFPQTTQAVLDMSSALGQDLKSSAIQLGKALNDPIQGISALQRVGVSFNAAQQEMITTMVKSGQTMEAQKFILAEIEKEFGGSAQSAYAAASSVTKLQKSFVDLEQDIGSGITPALNNLFTAFSKTTSGMGQNVDVGLLVFKSLSSIEEAAVALGNTLAQTGIGLAAFKGEAKKFFDAISFYSGDTKNKILEQDDAQLASIGNMSNKSSDFLQNLVDADQDVLSSWGDSTVAAKALGKAGPAAYQATAEEATKAGDAMKKTQQTIADTQKTLDAYRKDLQGETNNIAQAFVDEEQKIADLKKEIADKTASAGSRADLDEVGSLSVQLAKEQAAFDANKGVEAQLPTQVADARRRAGETDFERNLEDISGRVTDKEQSFASDITYNINFNDAVAGDDGIKKIITSVLTAINRGSTLKQVGGV